MSDKIITLPSDQAERKRLKGVVKELVDAQIQLDAAKDLIKSILEVEKEKGYDTGFIKKLAELSYDIEFNEKKKVAAIELSAERIAETEILMGYEKD